MSGSVQRFAAIVRADFLVRFRRTSMVVVFLLMSACAYLWVPDPSTGRALIQVAGRRAVYNSAAIGMATAMLGTICIGLFGFYVVSNALRRDIESRCGFVIASTPVRGGEYIAGKFAGNVVFLTVFMSGFMLASMTMLLVRGEAPLEPLVFVWQYVLLVTPAIVFVSAIAITFESVPLLRGKFGDVFYFFLWVMSVSLVAVFVEQGGGHWLRYLDFSGFAFAIHSLKSTMNTIEMSIGSSPFDPGKPPITFHGLRLTGDWVLPRIGAAVMPVALLVVARSFFDRFDPARVRARAAGSHGAWRARVNAPAGPLARLLTRLLPASGPVAMDARAAIAAAPLIAPAMIGFAIASLFANVLPIAFAAVALAIADIASREKRAGTTALVFAAPKLRERFVVWKFLGSLLVAAVFLLVPALTRPAALPALVAGLVFTCAAATALGIVSGNPKAFIVSFLTFWYLVVNDRGATPALDFAGFYGTATPAVTAAYAAAAIGLLALAHLFHRFELKRRW